MTIYGQLLSRGYFPKELPPAFFTEDFSAYARTKEGRKALWSYVPAQGYTEPVAYRLALAGHKGLAIRPLGIPNPWAFASLAEITSKHFRRLLKKAGSSQFSKSRPVFELGRQRAIRTMIAPSCGHAVVRIPVREGRAMKRWRPKHPARVAARRAIAQRRVGRNARCCCGESRPEALIRATGPTRCAECQREAAGRPTIDEHHVAGQNNSPVTIPVSANDHRAELSVMQMDWPRVFRENPERDPIIAVAASLRGATDVILFVIEKCVDTAIALLEALAEYLTRRFGSQWWRGTTIERFAPRP